MSQTNNWYVITGSPCSGKTSVLSALQKKGFHTIEEAARIYIDQELTKGKTLMQIRRNELNFQKKVLQLKIDTEKKLLKDKIIFFERGIPDSWAYYKLCGKMYDVFLNNAIRKSNYKKVFLLELLDYQKDYARTETLKQAIMLEKLLKKIYTDLKIPLIKIKKMPINRRVQFVLDNL
jgi:predicted ATPase